MTESTARVYRSELRARQARETRARIIAAAGELFARQGYQATTIAAIARAAGVSGETVKTAASKAELLIAAFEVTFSGYEGAESLTDTDVAAGVLDGLCLVGSHAASCSGVSDSSRAVAPATMKL